MTTRRSRADAGGSLSETGSQGDLTVWARAVLDS